MTAKWVAIREGEVGLVGDLTFETIQPLCKAIGTELPLLHNNVVCLSKVQRCDSASLILLLMVIEHFQDSQFSVSFIDMPSAMRTLINLYSLQSIITSPHDV